MGLVISDEVSSTRVTHVVGVRYKGSADDMRLDERCGAVKGTLLATHAAPVYLPPRVLNSRQLTLVFMPGK